MKGKGSRETGLTRGQPQRLIRSSKGDRRGTGPRQTPACVFPTASPSGTLPFSFAHFLCLGKPLPTSPPPPTPRPSYSFYLPNSHSSCKSQHKCQFFYETFSSSLDSRAPPTTPPKKFEAPSLCNTYLISIVIVGTFPSQLLWAPRGLGPCLFTFVTVHLALDQYVLNEEMRSVEPDQ